MHRNAFGQLVRAPYLRFFAPEEENGGGGYKAPESQEALDKLIQDRVARAEKKAEEKVTSQFADYAEIKAKAEKLAEIENGKKTPDEQLDARLTAAEQRAQKAEEDAAKIRDELVGERVQSTFKSAMTGRALNTDALFAFNPKSFVKDGSVDAESIKEWVETNSTEVKPGQQKVPGQGDRDASANGGSVQSGRDLYDSTKKPSRKE